MDIIYISNLCSENTFEHIKKISFRCPSLCEQKYHRVMTEGLSLGNNKKIQAITALPISRNTCKKLFIRRKKDADDYVEYKYISAVNIPIIKQIFQMCFGFFSCFFKCLTNKKVKVLCDMLCGSVAKGARLAAKITGREFTGIITDIPTLFENGKQSKRANKILLKQMKSCDSYVLLTETMNDVLNIDRKKAYQVIEGQANMNCLPPSMEVKYSQNVCIYAGAVEKIYGLDRLVQAFLIANLPNTELHIYGDGDYVQELKELCQKSTAIKYCGIQKNEIVVEEERKAVLLINPRPTDKEYVKYSFPSKTIEYLASGTAVLTTDLPGIPEEYKEYVYVIKDESVAGISKRLKEVLSKPREELFIFGEKAQKWLMHKKNSRAQAKRIFDMWMQKEKCKGKSI